MKPVDINNLAILRILVGYLGEREESSWWQSSFFTSSSPIFLTPIFGRTQLLAQYTGLVQAATVIHDERIGTGRVYHLFRLPESLEEGIHRAVKASEVEETVGPLTAGKEAALAYLKAQAGALSSASVGPTLVGQTRDINSAGSWRQVAAHYAQAFESGVETYPYFTDRS